MKAKPLALIFSSLLSWASRLGAQPYEVVVFAEDLMIPMSDGVRLAADVYRPARAGRPLEAKLPILLQRTPYNKKGAGLVEQARYFARQGYLVVLQDVRGQYKSEGVFNKYIGEGRDGFDTIEYLARLPYAQGKVGMWGTSYAAHVQANAAKLRPPHLATLVLNMGGMYNGWDHKIRNHGAFELQQLTWAFRQLAEETDDPRVRELLQKETARDWLSALPFRRGLNPLSLAPHFEDFILTMMTRADYDDYWKQPDINWVEHFDETADIPMLHVTGWYDSYCGGTVKNYLGLSRRLNAPIHLLIGPWTHGGNARSYAGEVEFGPEAALADFHRELQLGWFDRFLKGRETAASPRVRVFVMGTGDGRRDENRRLVHGGYWRTADDWPLPGTELTPYYFHADGSLKPVAPGEQAPPTTYTFDPRWPVPTIGGAFSSTSPVFEPGAYDQREREDFYGSRPPYLPLKARPDVVVFQSEPLEKEIEVVGPIAVRLYASSTALDTDFTIKLIDVYPESADFPSGFAMNLTDGILRARYRESPSRAKLMRPGEVYPLDLEAFPTANRFKKGHRIRLDVSSSNFPRFDVNPNTGEPLGASRRWATADNSIHHSARYPSHLLLPVVPSGR
jgi:hypothetical protein